jgi:competence/damage-inducible protein CinA-like protein
MIKIEILSTGDEILWGQIVDTNASWIANLLFNHGFPINKMSTVGDSLETLTEVLKERSKAADVLIISGGLGPTSDDLTARAAALASKTNLKLSYEWLEKIEQYAKEHGIAITPGIYKQAKIPDNAEIIHNAVGTACGFRTKINNCLLLFTPGVPTEFKSMITQEILPILRSTFKKLDSLVCFRLTTFGYGESILSDQLTQVKLLENTNIGYRSYTPFTEIKLTGPDRYHTEMEKIWSNIQSLIYKYIIFEGDLSLPELIAKSMIYLKYSLVISDQCTLGLLGQELMRSEVPVVFSETTILYKKERLDQHAERASMLAIDHNATVSLSISIIHQEEVSIVLCTRNFKWGQRLKIVNYKRYSDSKDNIRKLVVDISTSILYFWLEGNLDRFNDNSYVDTLEILKY